MAQLANLGQPFGSPGRIINIPAPAGSQLAGQIQMRAMEGLGRALGQYLSQKRQGQDLQENLRRMQSMPQTQDIFNTMYGARGMQPPQAQMPTMVGPQAQQMQLQGMMGQRFQDPLEREYLQKRIESTEALTEERKESMKFAEPDRAMRYANLQLRIADGAMREYYWAEEGPFRDKLLKQATTARERAVNISNRYGGEGSEEIKLFSQQLESVDEEIKKAGGKVEPVKVKPVKKVVAKPNRLRDIIRKYGRPKEKKGFDATLSHITTEEGKDIYFEMYWRPEFGR